MTSPDTFEAPRLRVSIFERLVPLTALAIASLGPGLTAIYIRSVFRALRENENAGIGAVSAGMTEANIAVVVCMYLGVLIGFAAIIVAIARMFAAKETSSPPFWFYILPTFLALIPAGLLWYLESLVFWLIDIANKKSVQIPADEITATHALIGNLSIVIIAFSIILAVALLILAMIPFSVRSGRRIATVIFIVLIEGILIAAAIVFQMNTMEFYKMAMNN